VRQPAGPRRNETPLTTLSAPKFQRKHEARHVSGGLTFSFVRGILFGVLGISAVIYAVTSLRFDP
jgi:hypothetical protein